MEDTPLEILLPSDGSAGDAPAGQPDQEAAQEDGAFDPGKIRFSTDEPGEKQ